MRAIVAEGRVVDVVMPGRGCRPVRAVAGAEDRQIPPYVHHVQNLRYPSEIGEGGQGVVLKLAYDSATL